ncbi:hypothetical protein KY290_001402 [Solanum tuberosum]|uniref:DUF659 domain-containing protein n=1 Tax=Solanum tuberosum TaxID=4113 RepID=A0ABQ7WM79_SOLTU|nr:hypothetical protein KY290_001402 [Solanum tuberosum]
MNHEASMVNLVDNDEIDDNEDEMNMSMGPPSKYQRMPSSSGSGSSTNSNVLGPMNLYFLQKSNEKRKGGPIDLESSRKILRDRDVSVFARWRYHAGLPFNCVNYTESFGEFIEAVGQNGSGMKPPPIMSDSSTDSNNMLNLFENIIMKIDKENVVQFVTDNASENKKVGNMLKGVFPHIFWTPCAAHCINLIFGDIFKESPYSTGELES